MTYTNTRQPSAEFASEFKTQNTKGKAGEAMFIKTMTARGHSVQDVSNVKEYQDKDLDFIVSEFKSNGEITTIELKTDYYATSNNLFLEVWSRKPYINPYQPELNDKGNPGWMKKSDAEVLCYYFAKGFKGNSHNCFFIDLTALKNWARANLNLLKLARLEGHNFVRKYDNTGREIMKITEGYLLPYYLLKQSGALISEENWSLIK